ncbi:MAG: PH domain-containing protein, partial [Chloroflexota bacterium]|nr:PH domain-containing protein [Chloroflexota bacterium]
MGYIEGLLAKNEVIVVKTRQHWMVLAGSIVANLILAIIIFAIVAALILTGIGVAIAPFALLLLLVPIFLFLRDYLNWWNEEYLVTNRRIIQAEGVINKHVIDSSLEKVNDVVLNQSFLGRLFDY